MDSTPTLYAAAGTVLCTLLYLAFSFLFDPLRHIPGPFLPRVTKAHYLLSLSKGQHHLTLLEQHRRYAPPGQHFAPIVRLGPRMYSIKAPEKAVYGISSNMPKAPWYNGWKHPSAARWSIFSEPDIKRHNAMRRLYANMYSLSTLLSYESYVSRCTDLFMERLGEMAARGEAVDMGHWLQCFAFDVMGMITYGERFGFLDGGEDVGGIMGALERMAHYSTLVGVYAWAHPVLYRILEWIPSSGAAGRRYLIGFAGRILARRREERAKAPEKEEEKTAKEDSAAPQDFVDKMFTMQDQKPSVTPYHVFSITMANIVAGADTTALSTAAILYHLLRTPSALAALRAEITTAIQEGTCTRTSIPFSAAHQMPYLQACIKEGLRLHPGTGLPMWRVVPAGGATICGQYFPAGTEVGLNSWIAHYDADIWGADAAVFRPERWLEAEGEALKVMETNWVPFGMGSRSCLGRHIGMLELSKLVPLLVSRFDFEREVEGEWETVNWWFVKPVGFRVRVSERGEGL